MRTDREALIAGIAADPHNDLRKLVFADWLEEHGEPERAEFIRLAIDNKDATTRTKVSVERAKELFAKHWRKWFGPFLEALDPERGADGYALVPERDFRFRPTYGTPYHLLGPIDGSLGLILGLGLNLEAAPDGSSLDLALRSEPIWWLAVHLAREPRWKQVTGPSLDQVSHLSFNGTTNVGRGETPPDLVAILNDRNLNGVTSCNFSLTHPNGSTPLPVLESFVASHIARQIRNLFLDHVSIDDLRHLCDSRRVKLDRLHLFADRPRQVGELLASARFATTLKEVTVQFHGGNRTKHVSPMLLALCAGKQWHELTALVIHIQGECVGGTNAGLKALANASFLPQLEALHIPLARKPDPKLITAVVERLDPARVRTLRFEHHGDVPLPECLVRLFGNRVAEGVHKMFGTAYWQVR